MNSCKSCDRPDSQIVDHRKDLTFKPPFLVWTYADRLCQRQSLGLEHKNQAAGFELAHREAGLPVDPDPIECGAFNHRFGLVATRTLLDSTTFSAMCCMSDMLAMGVTVALRERGLSVPEDCAVMGFDNIYIALLLVRPLSTIERRISEAGALAIGALIDFLDDPTNPRRMVLMEPDCGPARDNVRCQARLDTYWTGGPLPKRFKSGRPIRSQSSGQ
ncbi:substrate-binding domain-containing protein [Mesorhizobium sp. M1060]|uniref:substrate-binding domain-containing protein n=1 Tax=Mesorhizobium sp. M1060 TaxID=2957052 RepID=UPI00333D20A3